MAVSKFGSSVIRYGQDVVVRSDCRASGDSAGKFRIGEENEGQFLGSTIECILLGYCELEGQGYMVDGDGNRKKLENNVKEGQQVFGLVAILTKLDPAIKPESAPIKEGRVFSMLVKTGQSTAGLAQLLASLEDHATDEDMEVAETNGIDSPGILVGMRSVLRLSYAPTKRGKLVTFARVKAESQYELDTIKNAAQLTAKLGGWEFSPNTTRACGLQYSGAAYNVQIALPGGEIRQNLLTAA